MQQRGTFRRFQTRFFSSRLSIGAFACSRVRGRSLKGQRDHVLILKTLMSCLLLTTYSVRTHCAHQDAYVFLEKARHRGRADENRAQLYRKLQKYLKKFVASFSRIQNYKRNHVNMHSNKPLHHKNKLQFVPKCNSTKIQNKRIKAFFSKRQKIQRLYTIGILIEISRCYINIK